MTGKVISTIKSTGTKVYVSSLEGKEIPVHKHASPGSERISKKRVPFTQTIILRSKDGQVSPKVRKLAKIW
jgi:hypothetical protein